MGKPDLLLLPSERVVLSAPLSFAGSARRIWAPVHRVNGAWAILAGTGAVLAISLVWTVVAGWYTIFGLWVVPYRLLRRWQRHGKRRALQHRELVEALGRPPESR